MEISNLYLFWVEPLQATKAHTRSLVGRRLKIAYEATGELCDDGTSELPVASRQRLGDAVPAGVELGYHLCYDDAGHKHFKVPGDMTKLVVIANALAEGVKRTIDWIHMPVPRNRTDDAYFLPIRHLRIHPETELYLGLVHFTNGVEGTQRRIETAQRFVPHFGVATECGLGRRAPETIPELLRIHREVAQTVV